MASHRHGDNCKHSSTHWGKGKEDSISAKISSSTTPAPPRPPPSQLCRECRYLQSLLGPLRFSCHSLDSSARSVEGHSACIACLFFCFFGTVRAGQSRARAPPHRQHVTETNVPNRSAVTSRSRFQVQADSPVSRPSGPCIKNSGGQRMQAWAGRKRSGVCVNSVQHCSV